MCTPLAGFVWPDTSYLTSTHDFVTHPRHEIVGIAKHETSLDDASDLETAVTEEETELNPARFMQCATTRPQATRERKVGCDRSPSVCDASTLWSFLRRSRHQLPGTFNYESRYIYIYIYRVRSTKLYRERSTKL